MDGVKTGSKSNHSRCEYCLKTEFYDPINKICSNCNGGKFRIIPDLAAYFADFLYYKRRFVVTLSFANILFTSAYILHFFMKVSHRTEIIFRVLALLTMLFNLFIGYTFFRYA